LYQRHDVTRIRVLCPSYLISAICFLEDNYRELCHDISTGTLSPKITDPSLRACVINTFMDHPDTELADFIEKESTSGTRAGILKRIWP
ncbi:GH3 family domain-containing protein, partial [Klebsiella pneumoniae]|uniref:GH3 family domain-containing protein n=1 Tax=Klebsiella pneumoniae TaxID=573 RepID=UPI00351D5CF1